MAAPTTKPIGTPFGRKGHYWAAGYHTGVDFLTPTGTAIKAPADSRIIFAGRGGWGTAYGIMVIGESKGTDGKTYRWIAAHLSSESVSSGQSVKLGATIGRSGATGNVTGPHCHFEVRAYNRNRRDGVFGYWDHVNPSVILNVKKSGGTSEPTDRMDPANYYLGATGSHIKWLDDRLNVHGIEITPSTTFTEADKAAVAKFQRRQGWSGSGADGLPGALTLTRLSADPPKTAPPPSSGSGTVEILPRSTWTTAANGREGRPLSVSRVDALTLHYPGDGNVAYAGLTVSQVAAKLRAYREHHKARGWADIGYNYAVDGSGRVYFLTGDNIGAHSGDAGNPTSIGVLLLVGNTETPTSLMVEAVARLYELKRGRFPNLARLQGHRQVPGNSTSCPGDVIVDYIENGRFVVGSTAPPPKPAPIASVPSGQVVEERAATLNVNAGFRAYSAYLKAIPAIVRVRDKARARHLVVTEQGTAAAAIALSDKLGKDWDYTREQGRDSRLSTAIHFDTTKDRLLDSGRFDISTSTHDNGTWGLFQDKATGVLRFRVGTLLWPFPIGPNNRPADDKIREDAMRSMLRQSREYCRAAAKRYDVEHIPILPLGDLNHDKDDKPDAPGKAMSAYRFKDSDVVAKKRINGQYSTHSAPGGLRKGGRIDRIGIDVDGMECVEQETIDAYPVGSKHNLVVVSVRAANRKIL